MPSFKRSQSQSKNGGRRRKHTMRKLRRMKKSRKVMRGGVGGWVPSMDQDKQYRFNNLLYKYFADKATGRFDIDPITKLETRDEVANAIHKKIQEMKMTTEKEDEAYAAFEDFFK